LGAQIAHYGCVLLRGQVRILRFDCKPRRQFIIRPRTRPTGVTK
jgi:hypothetical protein